MDWISEWLKNMKAAFSCQNRVVGSNMIYIGIDPGKTGAIASVGSVVLVADLCLDASLFLDQISDFSTQLPTIFIERAQMRPGQNCTQTLINYGKLLGILDLLGFKYHEVYPQTWKSTMRLFKKDKNASLALARSLFPEVKEHLKRKKDHNRAEALLIAEFGRRISNSFMKNL